MSQRALQARLVVFSDDWGRHPSSCQHLVRHLLERHATLWVNTIGTRPPRLSAEDLGKAFAKLRQWLAGGGRGEALTLPEHLTIINPTMWPGFRKAWQRRFNARRIVKAVHDALGPREPFVMRVAITTVPITADLVGRLDVDRWVYYCPDDFSVWPGLDGSVMQAMEAQQAPRVDRIIAVSDALVERLSALSVGKPVELLTHGIDLEHWAAKSAAPSHIEAPTNENASAAARDFWPADAGPIKLFWGLIDQRLDMRMIEALAATPGTLVLVGPTQSPDPRLARLANVRLPGAAAYDVLPQLAAGADVLVMPYADLPVTRAMQPLKLKEYLATGRPVVVSDLPATRPWADCCDVTGDPAAMAQRVEQRIAEGMPASQAEARKRLADETWKAKAEQLERIMFAGLS